MVLEGHVNSDTFKLAISGYGVTIESFKIIPEVPAVPGKPAIPAKPPTYSGGTNSIYSKSVLEISDSNYFTHEDYRPVDIGAITGTGDDFDAIKLYKSGFSFNYKWYEFTDDSTPLYKPDATRIDISNCNNMEEISQAMELALGREVKVKNDEIQIRSYSNYYGNHEPFQTGVLGIDGLFTNPSNGADHNRLEYAYDNISNAMLQTTESESRIRDADMAKMALDSIKFSLLQQTQLQVHRHTTDQAQQTLSLLK